MYSLFNNVAVAIILMHAVFAQLSPPPPPLLVKHQQQTTENLFDVYDTQSSEEFFDPMKQPDKALRDFLLTNTKNYYVPQSLITIPMEEEDLVTDSATEVESDAEDDDIVAAAQPAAPLAMRRADSTNNIRSSTSSNDYLTTLEADGTLPQHNSEPSNVIDQLLVKEIEETDNASQLPYPAELTSNKKARIFMPPNGSVADVPALPHWPVHRDNKIHTDQYAPDVGFNDTEDDELTQDSDVETPTSTFDPSVTDKQDNLAVPDPTLPIPTTTIPTLTTTTTIATLVTRRKKNQTSPPRIFKYSADETLRLLLNDSFIRAPMAALIDTSAEVLRKTKTLWKTALQPQTALDIVLVAFNSSGVGVTYSFKNTRTMIAGLDSIQESSEGSGSAFFGILRACELIPYDSVIFICTDRMPLDVNMAQYAAITLLKKRIRLNLIWFGPQLSDDNQTLESNSHGGILGEVALRSGGEIMPVTEEALGPNGDFGLITLYQRNEIQGPQELDIPVEPTVSNLLIKLQGNVESATLDTPTGG